MTPNSIPSVRRRGAGAVALITALLLAVAGAPTASADKAKVHWCNGFPPCGQGDGNHFGQFKNAPPGWGNP